MLFSILFLIGFSILRDCSGCKYHPGCCIPNDEIENATLKQNVWNIKKRWMESVGELHIMRECTWHEMLKCTPESVLPKTDISRILLTDTKGEFLPHIDFYQFFQNHYFMQSRVTKFMVLQ